MSAFPRGFLLKSTRTSVSPPARAESTTENNDTEDSQILLDSTRREDGAIHDSSVKHSLDDSCSSHATTPAVEALTEWDDLSSSPSGIPLLKERPAGSQESLRSIARLKYPPTVQRRPSTGRRRAQTLVAERSVSDGRYSDAAVLQLPMTTPPRPSHLLNSSDTAGVGRSATIRSAHSTSSKASLAATTSSIGSTPSASPAAITKASVASLHPAKSTMLDKLRASASSSSKGLAVNEDQADIETPSRLPVLVRRRAGGTCADESPVSASASEPNSSSPASAKSEKIKNRKGTPFNIDSSAASPGRFKRSDAEAPPVPSAQYVSTATPRADDLAPAISGGQVSNTEDAGGLSSGEETGNLSDEHFVSPARHLYSQDEQNEASSREMSHPRQALERHRRTRSVPEGQNSPSSLQPSLLFPAPASTAPSEASYESDDSRRRPLWAAVGDLRTLDDPSHDSPPSAGTPPFSVRSTSSATGSAISSCSNYDSEPLHNDTPQWTASRRGPSDLEPPGTVSTLSTQTIDTPDMAQEERSMLPELKLTSPGRTETHVESEITPPNARRLQYPSKYARRVPPQVLDESELRQMPSTSTGTGDRSTAPPEDPVHTAVLEEYFSQDQSTYTRLGRQAVASISSLSSKASMEDLNRSIQRHQLEERERIATHAKALRESIDQAQRKSEEKQPATSSFLPDISGLRLGRRRPSTAKSTQSSRSETAASCKSATPRPSLAASTTTSFSTQMPDTKGDNFGTKAYRSLRTKVSGLFHPGSRQVSHMQDQTDLQYSPPPPMPKQDSATWARFTTSKASRTRRKDQSDSDQSFGHDPQVGQQHASSNRSHRRERAKTVVPSGKRPPIPATLTEVVVSSRVGCEDQKSPSESPNDPRSLSSSFVLLDKVDPIGGPRGFHGPQKTNPTIGAQESGLELGLYPGKTSQTDQRSAPIAIPQRRTAPPASSDHLNPHDYYMNPFRSTLSSSMSSSQWSQANMGDSLMLQSTEHAPFLQESRWDSAGPASVVSSEKGFLPGKTKDKGKGRAKGERKSQEAQAGGLPASSSLGSISDDVPKAKDESKGFISSMRSLSTWRKGASKSKKRDAVAVGGADSESGNSNPSSLTTGESPPLSME